MVFFRDLRKHGHHMRKVVAVIALLRVVVSAHPLCPVRRVVVGQRYCPKKTEVDPKKAEMEETTDLHHNKKVEGR